MMNELLRYDYSIIDIINKNLNINRLPTIKIAITYNILADKFILGFVTNWPGEHSTLCSITTNNNYNDKTY